MSSASLSHSILAAAERRLATDHAAALTLRGIARDVGITAPAIYGHFATKEQIVAEVVARRFAVLDAAIADAAESPDTALGRLRAACLAYCEFGERNPGHYALLFGPAPDHGGAEYAGSPGEATFAGFERFVRAAHSEQRGVAAGTDDDEVRQRAVAVWVAMHGIVTLRADLAGFPWPSLESQVDRAITAYLA